MSVGLVKDLTSAFEKAIAFRTGYNSEQICFLYNDKNPFNEELFNAIDEGVEYINPCGFRLEELLN